MYAMLQGVIFASWVFAGKRTFWRKVIQVSARTAVFRGSARMAGASRHRELPARSAIAVYRLSRVTETGPCPYLFRRCVQLLGNDITGDQGFYLSGMDDRLCGSAFGVVLPLWGLRIVHCGEKGMLTPRYLSLGRRQKNRPAAAPALRVMRRPALVAQKACPLACLSACPDQPAWPPQSAGLPASSGLPASTDLLTCLS